MFQTLVSNQIRNRFELKIIGLENSRNSNLDSLPTERFRDWSKIEMDRPAWHWLCLNPKNASEEWDSSLK